MKKFAFIISAAACAFTAAACAAPPPDGANAPEITRGIAGVEISAPRADADSPLLRIDIKNTSGATMRDVSFGIGFYGENAPAFTKRTGVYSELPSGGVASLYVRPAELDGITDIRVLNAEQNWFGKL